MLKTVYKRKYNNKHIKFGTIFGCNNIIKVRNQCDFKAGCNVYLMKILQYMIVNLMLLKPVFYYKYPKVNLRRVCVKYSHNSYKKK